MNGLLIIGASGHSKVVLDACLASPHAYALVIRDDNPELIGQAVLGANIEGPIGEPAQWPGLVHIAIGDNATRERFAMMAEKAGRKLVSIIHPEATVAPSASVGLGSLVAAKSVIGPDVEIGSCAIINHAAVVDHDCRISDYSHIAPGAIIGGGCIVGAGCLVGSGAVILPNVVIGDRVKIGSGSVVTKDVQDDLVVAGVPARKLIKK